MKRLLAPLVVLAGLALSGCYYDADYRYVRGNGYQGGAYYGQGPATIVEDDYYYGPGYYAPGYYASGYYGPGYYGYGYPPGVSVGVGGVWYGDAHHHHRGHDYRAERHRDTRQAPPPPRRVDRRDTRRDAWREQRVESLHRHDKRRH